MKFTIVAAIDAKKGIGRDGKIPWNLPEDMKWFKDLTTKIDDDGKINAVIMGRVTFDSIDGLLSNRLNIVITSQPELLERPCCDRLVMVPSFDKALEAADVPEVEWTYVIGGEQVYRQAIERPECQSIVITRLLLDGKCDRFFPRIDDRKFFTTGEMTMETSSTGILYGRKKFDRRLNKYNWEEYQYLTVIRKILAQGTWRQNRTGISTISVFGAQFRFNLRGGVMPLLTTKKVWWRGVAEELLWMISGSTDSTVLHNLGVNIWDKNAADASERSYGNGDLGPIYGFQWRHFGAPYLGKDHDYSGQGVDQLAQAITKIKLTPNDRRIIVSAWNPPDLAQMALPPCHMMFQFYVANGELSCHMYQRSCNMGLGVPFNIASYALLTHLVAHCCNLEPGDLILSMGDVHIYENHIKPLLTQLKRDISDFPTLKICTANRSIDGFTSDVLQLENYTPKAAIPMEMAV
jgi:dihydrofolate reductase/thymidylate synthase